MRPEDREKILSFYRRHKSEVEKLLTITADEDGSLHGVLDRINESIAKVQSAQ